MSRLLKIDRDKLNAASQKRVGAETVKIFATLQKLPREVQLLSLAAGFVLMSEVLHFGVTDTMGAVINLMKDPTTASGRGLQFDAMKFHLATELEGQPE